MSILWRTLQLTLVLAPTVGARASPAEPPVDATLDYPPSIAAQSGVDMLDESVVDETLDEGSLSSSCNCPPRRRVRPCYPPCDAPVCPDLPTDPNSWLINPGFDGCGCRWFRDVYCGEGCLCPPWRAQVGGVILHRSRPDDAVLLQDSSTLAPLVNARDLDPGWTGGADVLIERRFMGGAIQGRYFGAYDASDRLTVATPNGSFISDPVLFGISGVASNSVDYHSTIHSTELNWVSPVTRSLDWLAGFRWVELHDQMGLYFDGNSFQWNVDDHLYGAQLGVVGRVRPARRLSLEGFAKAGVYGNAASSDLYLLVPGLIPQASDRDGRTSFVGDLQATAVYRIFPHVALRGGYQAMWVEGLALASEQPAVEEFPGFGILGHGITTAGGLFYHGATASLEIAF